MAPPLRPFPHDISVALPMPDELRWQMIEAYPQDQEVEMRAQVEAARIPDRNRLLRSLREAGLDAMPVGQTGIEVPYDAESEQIAAELLRHAEGVIMRIGAPFVPIKHEGVIYIRPPLS